MEINYGSILWDRQEYVQRLSKRLDVSGQRANCPTLFRIKELMDSVRELEKKIEKDKGY